MFSEARLRRVHPFSAALLACTLVACAGRGEIAADNPDTVAPGIATRSEIDAVKRTLFDCVHLVARLASPEVADAEVAGWASTACEAETAAYVAVATRARSEPYRQAFDQTTREIGFEGFVRQVRSRVAGRDP